MCICMQDAYHSLQSLRECPRSPSMADGGANDSLIPVPDAAAVETSGEQPHLPPGMTWCEVCPSKCMCVYRPKALLV